jgi:hypothetical protein
MEYLGRVDNRKERKHERDPEHSAQPLYYSSFLKIPHGGLHIFPFFLPPFLSLSPSRLLSLPLFLSLYLLYSSLLVFYFP